MLLAACGGGGNLTTSSQPEPEPPVIGPLVPSSEGDGEQQKIIVIQQEEPEEDQQNEESEEIIDIIIEQPEEEEEEEEENQETQTQQITIIEEEDIPYVPPEEKEYETSPQTTQTTTTGLNLDGLNIGEEIIVDRVTTTLEGSFPAGPGGGSDFGYGLWASERAIHNNTNFIDNKIYFLELSSFLNPTTRTASNYTSHTISAGKIVAVSYRREDGFKGVYIYEGETGELTGDVDLIVGFNDNTNSMGVTGEILTDLEIEGYDLKGISMLNGRINYNTGVGGIDIDADGVDDNNTSAKLSFGEFLIDDNAIDRPTLSHRGLVRKVRMVLSPDAIQAQGSTPESYPSQIAGEVEINGFKIKAGDGDHNTVVGVFIGDKQEQ